MVIVCEDLKMSVLNFNTLLSGFNYMDLKELAIKYNVTATDDADKKASHISWKTAITRSAPSAPLKKILSLTDFPKPEGTKILDFGCGKGRDVQQLKEMGYDAQGYDQHFQPKKPTGKFDVVFCTFVINTRGEDEEAGIIRELKKYTKPSGRIFISVRPDVKEAYTSDKGLQRPVNCPSGFKPIAKASSYLIFSNK